MANTPPEQPQPQASGRVAQSLVEKFPDEILSFILTFIPIPSIVAFAITSKTCRTVVYEPNFWSDMMSIYFPDAALQFNTNTKTKTKTTVTTNSSPSTPTPYQQFSTLAARHRHPTNGSSSCGLGCNGTLLLPQVHSKQRRRCPCIVTRSEKILPLQVGCLCQSRSGSSYFATSPGFSTLRRTITEHFHSTPTTAGGHTSSPTNGILPIETITPESLHNLDVFLLCTTEGPPLSESELTSLKEWVYEKGGALIVSAFSQWSAEGHYAERTVGWLGIIPNRGAQFRPKMDYTIQSPQGTDSTVAIDDETMALVSNGPFGPVKVFRNIGDSLFRTTSLGTSSDNEDGAIRNGAVHLVRKIGRYNLEHKGEGLLLFYPPGGRLTGKRGRILVCSNYHWLADSTYWSGGTFLANDGAQRRLFLNFVAGAVASRVQFGGGGVCGSD